MHHRRRPLGGGLVPRFFEAKKAAHGRWPQLLRALGITDSYLTGRHGPCPGCGGKDRFRFDDQGSGRWFCSQGGGDPASGDGFSLLEHAGITVGRQQSLARVLDALAFAPIDPGIEMPPGHRWQLQRDCDRSASPSETSPRPGLQCADNDTSAPGQEMWRRGVPLAGTPGDAYLRSRRLVRPWPDALLWLPLAEHTAINVACGRKAGNAPRGTVGAVLAGITSADTGMLVAVQRVFVDRQARKLEPRTLGRYRGNACRLWPYPDQQGRWGIAEGVETAMAAHQLTGIPTWSAVAAGNFTNIVPPSGAIDITVFADRDPAGIAAAQKAAALWSSHSANIRIVAPLATGTDMNDLVQPKAIDAA